MGPKSAKSAKYRVFCGYTWKTPGIPGKYPATAWVSCRFPQFCLRFCPRPALRLRETREFPEWSTKHPLFSLEISGNAKCWGPSVFLFVCRKSLCRPSGEPRPRTPKPAQNMQRSANPFAFLHNPQSGRLTNTVPHGRPSEHHPTRDHPTNSDHQSSASPANVLHIRRRPPTPPARALLDPASGSRRRAAGISRPRA